MCFSLKKIFFPLFGIEFLKKEAYRLCTQVLQHAKASLRKELFSLLFKAFVGLAVLGMTFLTLFLFLTALALYLNEVLCSSYLGFLVVAVGCTGLLLLLLICLMLMARWRQR